MKSHLAKVFDEILREVESNPGLSERIDALLTPTASRATASGSSTRPRNRRAEPAVDPYETFRDGELALRTALSALSPEQLKDVISAYSLDSSRLALKWKDRERLRDLIVTTVKARVEKGDAFRTTT